MLNSKLKRTALALVLSVVLMLSLFPVAAYALEDAGSAAEGDDGIVMDAGQTTDTAEVDAETTADTPSETEAETTAETDDHDHDHDHDHDDEQDTEEKKGLSVGDIISLAVLGVVIIAVVVYCLIKREKVAKLWRSLKSEFKKIVWSPWNQVRKNTLVVLAVVIAAAIVIFALDLLFSRGIMVLSKFF